MNMIQLKGLVSCRRDRAYLLSLGHGFRCHSACSDVPCVFAPNAGRSGGHYPGQRTYGSGTVEDARALMPQTLVAPDVSPPPDGVYGAARQRATKLFFILLRAAFETSAGVAISLHQHHSQL